MANDSLSAEVSPPKKRGGRLTPIMRRRVAVAVAIAAIVGVAAFVLWPRGYCKSAKARYGLELPRCPDGELRQVLSTAAERLQRGGEGTVRVSASALYTTDRSDGELRAPIGRFEVELSLVDARGAATPLAPKDGWSGGEEQVATVALPDVPDGDYRLRARVSSRVGESSVDLPLGLYAPARIHVLTDRPLYEPGHRVRFRALSLRANDLTPIDGRPGKWIVTDPSGEVLLEEQVEGGPWGIVAGDFPLDAEALEGDWTVRWDSGADSASASFTVEPFALPRFEIEAAAQRPFYRAGEQPAIAGSVRYASGAPVEGASVEISWSSAGSWPPPPAWMASLPSRLTAGPGGRFAAELPAVPDDLGERASLIARIAAVDATGDRVTGTTSILLSADSIAAEALTELEGGLVQGSNNRVYLRVTSADGRPLPGASVVVRRAWEPGDRGIATQLDADSVARVQLDPGPPVNVVIPPMPARRPLADSGPPVTRIGADDLISGTEASLADRAAMDRWLAPLAGCARWVPGGSAIATVALRVEPTGAIAAAVASPDPLSECAAAAARRLRLPAGSARVYRLRFQLRDPGLPRIGTSVTGSLGTPPGIDELFRAAALDGRRCLAAAPGVDGSLATALAWQIRAGERAVSVSAVKGARGTPLPAAAERCLLAAVRDRRLPEPAESADLGLTRLSVIRPEAAAVAAPQPTIMKGYELAVAVSSGPGAGGETLVRMAPGEVPNLRLRPTPILPAPGETVEVELIRGPEWSGELPEKLAVSHRSKTELVEIDREARTARVEIPKQARGWFELRAGGAVARVFVRAGEDLRVAIAPEKESYRPGETARLAVKTEVGGEGAAAAVGLFGVDASLAQLAPLPGADALAGLRPAVEMEAPAFGVLEAQALALGRIRGESAAEATVLRVSRVPEPAAIDIEVSGSAQTLIDPIAELTDRFYPVLTELHARARAWEASAPVDDKMTPETMARLWGEALEAVAERGGRIDDAFGRVLRLHRLPDDLLALTAPHQVVGNGTRLTEDVENWSDWVRRRKP